MAKDNKLSKSEIKELLEAAQLEKDEKSKTELFLESLEDAPIATIIKAVKQKGLFVRVKAGFADDRWEAKELKKKAYNITNSVRSAGGFSY